MGGGLPIEEFIDPGDAHEIVSSQTFRNGEWERLTRLNTSNSGVLKNVVPVDAAFFRMLVITKVSPNTKVSAHSHDEPILRYVMSGGLSLNGVHYTAGDWVLVPSNFEYSVETTEGYTTIAGYGVACDNGN